MATEPKPPEGYDWWMDYAVATMDTRSIDLENIDAGGSFQREDYTAAARAELDELRKDAKRWHLIDKLILGTGAEHWIDKWKADQRDAKKWREMERKMGMDEKDKNNGN